LREGCLNSLTCSLILNHIEVNALLILQAFVLSFPCS
jgi:hypothetical protein